MAAEPSSLLTQKGECYGKGSAEMNINSSFKKLEGTGNRQFPEARGSKEVFQFLRINDPIIFTIKKSTISSPYS